MFFKYYANQDINKNEELTIDYGSSWWSSRDLKAKKIKSTSSEVVKGKTSEVVKGKTSEVIKGKLIEIVKSKSIKLG